MSIHILVHTLIKHRMHARLFHAGPKCHHKNCRDHRQSECLSKLLAVMLPPEEKLSAALQYQKNKLNACHNLLPTIHTKMIQERLTRGHNPTPQQPGKKKQSVPPVAGKHFEIGLLIQALKSDLGITTMTLPLSELQDSSQALTFTRKSWEHLTPFHSACSIHNPNLLHPDPKMKHLFGFHLRFSCPLLSSFA